MSLSQMQVFNKYIMPATIESLSQMVNKFNAASNGAIRLTNAGWEGDFMADSFFAAIHTAQRRVDRYAAQASAAATDLTMLKHSAVKIAGGFGPIRYEPSQMTWLLKPTAEGVEVASRNFAEALLADQLNTAIAALVAALSQAGTVSDVSATAGLTYSAINNTHALFGDMSGQIVCEVMTGAMYHKFIGINLANAQLLFNAGNVTVISILNKAVIVTDAPALYKAGTPNKDYVLSLVDGAATVFDGGDIISNVATTNGQTRIETTLQVDYTFGLSMKGFTWDEANGGKSPTDAEIATATNWDKIATNIKQTAGVLTIGDNAK